MAKMELALTLFQLHTDSPATFSPRFQVCLFSMSVRRQPTMTMGDRLRELRLKKNISQEEVARQVGITRSAYSHYEINNRQPVYETLKKLAVLFNVSLDYIIGGEPTRQEAAFTPETIEIIRRLNNMDQDKRKQSIDKMLAVIKQAEQA
jgi:transcriptional regulator with XRE-family HTH domain